MRNRTNDYSIGDLNSYLPELEAKLHRRGFPRLREHSRDHIIISKINTIYEAVLTLYQTQAKCFIWIIFCLAYKKPKG